MTGGREALAGRVASTAAAAPGIGRRTPVGSGRAEDSASAEEGPAPATTAVAAGRAAGSGAGEAHRVTTDRRAAALVTSGVAVHGRDRGNGLSSRAGVERMARDRPDPVDRPAPAVDGASQAHPRTALGRRARPARPARVRGRSTHPGAAARRTGAAPGVRSSPGVARHPARVRPDSAMAIVDRPVDPGRIDRPDRPRRSHPRHRPRTCWRTTRS
jgi:hypothetical protein